MSKAEKREKLLLDRLKTVDKLSTNQVMDILYVSESTARRMFDKLEKYGKVIRVFGAIKAVDNNLFEYEYDKMKDEKSQEKRIIAEKAVNLVSSNSIIYLDGGTTIAELALLLLEKLKDGSIKNVTVFTNSLVTFNILMSICPINLIGGEYRLQRRCFAGYLAENNLKKLNFDACFLGTEGFKKEFGFCTTDFETARFYENVIMHSNIVNIMADSSKFDKGAMLSFCSSDRPDSIVTDEGLSEELLGYFRNIGVNIIL